MAFLWYNLTIFDLLLRHDNMHNNIHHNETQQKVIQQNDIHHNETPQNDIQQNDIQKNDIQQNDIRHNDVLDATHSIMTLIIIVKCCYVECLLYGVSKINPLCCAFILNVVMPSVFYTECQKYTLYAVLYVECRYAEWRGDLFAIERIVNFL